MLALARKLVRQHDVTRLFEFTHPDYPDERLVACRNAQLAKLRAHKRESLLQATERNLEKVRASVAAGRLRGQDRIGVRVGKVFNQYKVAKHVELDIEPDALRFTRNAQSIATEAALDGLYIIHTSLSGEQADDAQCVRYYKLLAQVERGFRSMKSIDLHVRSIHHRLPERVRAHISVSSRPSCATPLARPAPAPMRRPSSSVASAQQQRALDLARQITV